MVFHTTCNTMMCNATTWNPTMCTLAYIVDARWKREKASPVWNGVRSRLSILPKQNISITLRWEINRLQRGPIGSTIQDSVPDDWPRTQLRRRHRNHWNRCKSLRGTGKFRNYLKPLGDYCNHPQTIGDYCHPSKPLETLFELPDEANLSLDAQVMNVKR